MNDRRDQTDARTAQLVMLDQQLALSAYLQALLSPVEPLPVELTPVEPLPESAPEPVIAVVPMVTATLQAVVPAIESAVTPAVAPFVAPVVAPPLPASVYPEWAIGDFQCLLFRVAGLTLALPLAKLNGVLPWNDALVTPLPGHQSWFLGLREYQGRKVRLIDVANVIVARDVAQAGTGLGKVILIGAGRWGLACDDIAEVVTLTPAAVKWRGRSGSRPWLAGTVIDRMCALIDADAFAQMLETEGPQAA
jgi:purine-binding chemotaxis protein CheW